MAMKTNTSNVSSDSNVKDLPEKGFTKEQYDKLMKGFEPLTIIGREWEIRGDSYVQYSAYDESLTCTSTASLNLIP